MHPPPPLPPTVATATTSVGFQLYADRVRAPLRYKRTFHACIHGCSKLTILNFEHPQVAQCWRSIGTHLNGACGFPKTLAEESLSGEVVLPAWAAALMCYVLPGLFQIALPMVPQIHSFIHSFIPSFIHSVIHSSWGPVDGNFAACRKCCCRPRPETGLVAPYLELKAQQMRYDVPYVALIAIATVIAILAAACGAIPSK